LDIVHEKLHGHHFIEDQNIFRALQQGYPAVAPVIHRLAAEHRRIDPLLQQADRVFGARRGRCGRDGDEVAGAAGTTPGHRGSSAGADAA
jgi:hypothetical protein